MNIDRQTILDTVLGHLLDNLEDLEREDIDTSRSMKELGASSLDIVEVVSCSMRDLRIKVPRSELNDLKNIDELVDLLHRVGNAKVA